MQVVIWYPIVRSAVGVKFLICIPCRKGYKCELIRVEHKLVLGIFKALPWIGFSLVEIVVICLR